MKFLMIDGKPVRSLNRLLPNKKYEAIIFFRSIQENCVNFFFRRFRLSSSCLSIHSRATTRLPLEGF
jgi:hypothetical protein